MPRSISDDSGSFRGHEEPAPRTHDTSFLYRLHKPEAHTPSDRDSSEASSGEERSSKRKLQSRLHGNPNVEFPQDSALAQVQRAGLTWGRRIQEERKQAENPPTIHYDNPATETGKITEIGHNRDSGSIISETEATEILGYKDVKKEIEKNIHIVLSQTPKVSFKLIREYEWLRKRKGTLSIIEYRKLQASSKGIGSDTESYLIDLNKFLRELKKHENSKTEGLDIEPIKELTVTQMRKVKEENYYENVLKKLDQLPSEGIEGILKSDLQLMCLPTVDMLNKISKRIIFNLNLAPFSSPFVLPKDIRLAKSAAIYDAWIRNLEKRIDTFLQNQNNISDLAAASETTSLKTNTQTEAPPLITIPTGIESKELPSLPSKPLGTVRRTARQIYEYIESTEVYKNIKWGCESAKSTYAYKKARRRLNPKRVEGKGNFVKYGQARKKLTGIKWKKAIFAYKKARRHPDPKRVEGEIVFDRFDRKVGGNFRLYPASEEKTKREIASEMIITRSYHSLLREMTRPDTKTFKDVYDAAEMISSNENIKISPEHHEEFLALLRTTNQSLKDMTQTIIASESSSRNIYMFQSAFRDAIQENKDIEGWINELVPNDLLADIEKRKVIIKVRRRKYLQHEQVSRIISDNRKAMELAESCAPNEAIEIYDQLIRARVEGGIVFDRNTSNFVTYDQARGSGLDGEDDPGPHSDQNGNTVEPSDPPDHPQEIHDLEQQTDNSSDHPETNGEPSDDKTKREIASELFIIRSYYGLLREINRPDTETFKDAYASAEWVSSWVSSKEDIDTRISPERYEEVLKLLRTTNQRLKEMTQTIIASDECSSNDRTIFQFAFRDAILQTKDIEGGISGINNNDQAMTLVKSCKPNEAIKIYDQLIGAKAYWPSPS